MNRLVITIIALLLFAFSAFAEKIVISQVLVTEPMPVSKPIFYNVENVEGKTFSDSDLLSFQHFDISGLFPVENHELKWFDRTKTLWNKSFTDEDGFIFINKEDDGEASIAYIASYIKSSSGSE